MKVWFFASSHPLQRKAVPVRTGRMRVLAEGLAAQGYDVRFFTSNFDHGKKAHFNDWLSHYKGVIYHAVPSPGYKRHISLRRMYEHRVVPLRIERHVAQLLQQKPDEIPDVIFCNWPTLEMANMARRVAKKTGAKLIIGVSDLWPDSFVSLAPSKFSPFVALYSKLLQPRTRKILQSADAISGLTQSYLRWAQSKVTGPRDKDFILPMTYAFPPAAARSQQTPKTIDILYSGVAGNNFDHTWVRDFLKTLLRKNPNIRIVFAGTGPKMDLLRVDFAQAPQVEFLGFLAPDALYETLCETKMALLGYKNIENFRYNLPNKVSEFAAFGIPIIGSIPGEIAHFINRFGCGLNVDAMSIAQAADTTLAFLSDLPRHASAAHSARTAYETIFNPELNVAKLAKCLEEVQRLDTK